MGGRPITCLNLACFPSKKLEPTVLHQIVAGALSKITEAGAVLAGGHTVEDDEPKFGLAVNGIVHPDKFWANTGAEPGDLLLLTKPLGSGVLFNANLKKWVSRAAMDECVATLITLNKRTAEIMGNFLIHAATDVTGFGLAGHGFEMARGSKVELTMNMTDLPVMREALEMYQKGMSTGVNKYNRALVENHLTFDSRLPAWHREIVFDPQTSGGLLVSVPEPQAEDLLKALHQGGVPQAAIIGRVKKTEGPIYLRFTVS